MKTFIDADIIESNRQQEEDYAAFEWMLKHPRLARIKELWFIIWFWTMENTICRCVGHTIEDAGSYAGPDSGAEHLACTRCCWEFHHIYY